MEFASQLDAKVLVSFPNSIARVGFLVRERDKFVRERETYFLHRSFVRLDSDDTVLVIGVLLG